MEHWLPVVGYEGLYEVSDHGRVRSLEKRCLGRWGAVRVMPSKLLRLDSGQRNNGYVDVGLCRGRRQKKHYVHRLVAAAFVPNPRGLTDVNHIDLNRANNAASNLEWVTPLANSRHAARLGRCHPATNPRLIRKLTAEDVEAIRFRRANGERPTQLAREFGVDYTSVWKIVTRRTWHHAPLSRQQDC